MKLNKIIEFTSWFKPSWYWS